MPDQLPQEYVLGIDLGTNSLGWAVIGLIDGEPAQIVRAGSRVFEAGMDGDISSGREESRNLKRREARGHRRLLWRRRRRLTKLFNLLQRFGLLPASSAAISSSPGGGHKPPLLPHQIQDYFNELDKGILSSPWFKSRANSDVFPEPKQTMPYILRALALDEPLEPYFLGRALYHLAQRRGFLSNRKQTAKKKDDEGVVKKEIGELRSKMEERRSRTLGEYFSRLGPSAGSEEQRIRRWHTHRDMFKDEFEKIWKTQAQHHPGLMTPDRKKQIYHAIFFQRPLWFDRNTIGRCELEPGKRRAPAWLLTSQRFRLLQKVNDLQIEKPGEAPRYLTPEERGKLSDALELHGEMKFDRARKSKAQDVPTVRELLNLPKGTTFNLQRGGEGKIPGNRTNSQFYGAFGERWLDMSADEHDRAIRDVLSIRKPATLKRRAVEHWKLDEPAASRLCEISLEPEYMNYSRKAMENLLPLLEQGIPLQTARKKIYPESFLSAEALPTLPPLEFASDPARFATAYRRWLAKKAEASPATALPPAVGQIRNPAVTRSLTELRKVVNAIIGQHGKPTYVHVEMARELKHPRIVREKLSKRNRENEAARKKAVEQIKKINGDPYPSRDDIRRIQLFDECHGACVYCGQPLAARNLLGKESQVDIDHIIPFSRSMDDSFANLVICHSRCNREKGNRTPFEAFSGDEEQYEHVNDRLAKFAGDREMVKAKAKRFQMDGEKLEEFLGDFRKRQLNDTAYASRVAADYLGLLYGGRVDQQHNLRVQVTAGRSTGRLRSRWRLNSILDDGPTTNGGRIEKKRTDHRHHAIDAVVIALTNSGMMERLADAAKRGQEIGKRFAHLDEPWPNFVDSVRAEIEKIIVSHRVSKKVSGALHEETIYSRPMGEKGEVRVRKPLASLTKSEVEEIADRGVKALVLAKLNGGDPNKVFASEENLPFFDASDDRRIPIKRVRINVPASASDLRMGTGRTQRYVKSGSNHHAEVFAELDEDNSEVEWDAEVVPMWKVYRRNKLGTAIVETAHGKGRSFKFSLAPNEVVECDDEKGGRRLLAMRKVSQFSNGTVQFGLIPLNKVYRKDADLIRVVPNRLRHWNSRKVVVSPLGEVTEAHD